MQTLIREDEDIKKAHEEYLYFTQNEKLRELYEARFKWNMDHNSDIAYAEKEGIKKGIKEGKIEDAIKMYNDGIKIDKISKYTDISIQELKNILKG